MDFIYTKKCLGKNKKPINVYKIRTMEPDADKRLEEIINTEHDSLGKPLHDPRITPLGKFLRKYWIDELPQLYNLARGDLKLVGIRPKSEEHWKAYPSEIMEKSLEQKPGLMGIQYAFPYSKDFNDNLRYMDDYLNQWEKDPFETDRKYLSKIVNNIMGRNMRSR